MIDYAEGYGPKDRKQLKGIRGPLIVIGSWNFTCILVFLYSYSRVSQVELTSVLSRHIDIPASYFRIASTGYLILSLITILLVTSFVKKCKVYRYLEIAGLILKSSLLFMIYRSLEGSGVNPSTLTELLPLCVYAAVPTVIYLFLSYRAKNTFVNKIIN